jgi:hypothetical protein
LIKKEPNQRVAGVLSSHGALWGQNAVASTARKKLDEALEKVPYFRWPCRRENGYLKC